jgi:hypothetical protein
MEIAGKNHHAHTTTNASDVVRITQPVLAKPDITQPDPVLREVLQPTNETSQTSIPTPVNARRLAHLLQGYDDSKTKFLVDGFTEGFRIPIEENWIPQHSTNHASSKQQSNIIGNDIQHELDKGRIAGPFDSPPFSHMFISPIGMVPKKEPGKFRRIHDLSCPLNYSVNSGIPQELCHVQYETLDNVTNYVLYYGPGCYLAKCDIETAFRVLPLHPSSYPLMGFEWNGFYYYDMCLPMGCSVSCRFFEAFSQALQWILQTKFKLNGITHILDDFMFVAKSQKECNRKLNHFFALAEWLNVPIKHSKTCHPHTNMVAHGLEVDTITMEIRLPHDKLLQAREQILSMSLCRKTTLRSLQSIIGLLNFACRAVVPGRAFLRRLITLTRGLTKPHHHIRLNFEARADLAAWKSFLATYNGRTLLSPRRWISSSKLHLFTDSAASLGYAAVFGRLWFMGQWPLPWKSFSIAFLELFPIVSALCVWASSFANKCIVLHTDNMSIVDIINSQSSKDSLIMYLVRRLVVITLHNNILFHAVHVPGVNNTIPDLLSRQQVQAALRLDPRLSHVPVVLPPDLQPENIELQTSSRRLRQIHLEKHTPELLKHSTPL